MYELTVCIPTSLCLNLGPRWLQGQPVLRVIHAMGHNFYEVKYVCPENGLSAYFASSCSLLM
jgi:hypothetical protein